ncbi:ATP-binding protein [Rhodobacteraceae bacterium NNCM2]|nr:ATP-binding protein [Coraliihabitans acroporae]
MIREFAVSQLGLKTALDSVKQSCRELQIDDQVANRLCVIVDETVANMLMHGGLDADAEFHLALSQLDSGARLEIRDPGTAFDPIHWPPVGHSGPGGRGITLTRGLAHDISYTRHGDHNVLTVSVFEKH